MKLIELEEVDSTNDYLKREYQNLPMQNNMCHCQISKQKVEVEMVMFGKVINENLIMSFFI